MKKTHLAYLRRIVNIAANFSGGAVVSRITASGKTPDTPVYRMMRDIVCDARFYSVIGNDIFWRNYSVWTIQEFIDSIPASEWKSDDSVSIRKEKFLTDWMTRHFTGLTLEEIEEISARIFPDLKKNIRKDDMTDDGKSSEEYDETDGTLDSPPDFDSFRYADDRTNRGDAMSTKNLPKELQDYIEDIQPAAGDSLESPHEAEARYLESIDPALTALAREIGRSGECGSDTKGRFRSSSRSDIDGIRTGNDLESVLPTELALLADRDTENIFLRRYVERQLQIFSSASRSPEPGDSDNGPVYICIDTSGSMSGTPERMAKNLAFAVSIIAQSEHRPVCLLNYSDSVDYFLLTNFDRQKIRLLKFLSFSYSGGNTENHLFEFIFRYLPQHPGFRSTSRKFSSADLLMISDFHWGGLSRRVQRYLTKARAEGMRIYSIAIGMDEEKLKEVYYEATAYRRSGGRTKFRTLPRTTYDEYTSGFNFLASGYSVNGFTEADGLVSIKQT